MLFQVSGDTTAEAPGQARRLVNMIRSCGEEYILMSFIGFFSKFTFPFQLHLKTGQDDPW